MIFLGYLETAQIVFYFIFLAFAIVNVVFIAVSDKTEWVRNRRLFVFAPYGVVVLLHIVSLVLFFSVLDDLNAKINNMWPVIEEDMQKIQSYAVFTFVLYMLPSLF